MCHTEHHHCKLKKNNFKTSAVTWLEVENLRLGGPIEKPKGLEENERQSLSENSRLAAGREIESRRIEKPPVKQSQFKQSATGACIQ